MAGQDRGYSYSLIVVDNFHMGDIEEKDEYELGPFASCDEAAKHARGIIDAFARDQATGKNADELYRGWAQYGETPILATNDPDCTCSGREYARRRFEELHGQNVQDG